MNDSNEERIVLFHIMLSNGRLNEDRGNESPRADRGICPIDICFQVLSGMVFCSCHVGLFFFFLFFFSSFSFLLATRTRRPLSPFLAWPLSLQGNDPGRRAAELTAEIRCAQALIAFSQLPI